MKALQIRPLTAGRWTDLENLFGDRGACGGCWCMYWRITRKEYEKQKGAGNRKAFRALVEAGKATGLLAYSGGEAVGWCAVGPRESFSKLERSRILKPVDEQPVWSITCLFVDKTHRRQGVSEALLSAATDYARSQGAGIVEGYPVEPKKEKAPDAFVFTGLASAFRQAGFHEVLRRSETRPIMRRLL